jgi:hypothetical protein
MSAFVPALVSMLLRSGAAVEPAPWRFDPALLRADGAGMTAHFRALGDMHGLIIDGLDDAGAPTARGRAFLNLEHYIEKGRCGEYLPRRLEHTAVLRQDAITIHFPLAKDWPVVARLTYTSPAPRVVDARLDFNFSGELAQFEVYFTSYFDPQYERMVKIGGKWVRPEIDAREQLLIPRDEKVAARYGDGRWGFLKDRTRLMKESFDLPVMISRNDQTGATVVQMIEPGLCTHIAPNRFAVGHNFIVGGWDVKAGDQRSARVRLIAGKNLSEAEVEQAYQSFAEDCRRVRVEAGQPATRP